MLDQHDKDDLIHHRIEQAKKTSQDADFLIQDQRFTAAVNRIYYAMFYMLSALALKHDFHTSKHQQLIGWFNKNFVKAGIIEPKYTKIITDAYENRAEGDYGVFVTFSEEDVLDMFADMKSFLTRIEQELLSEP